MKTKYTLDQLKSIREIYISNSTEKKFLGYPDSWYDDPTWFCLSGHRSKVYHKTELEGDVCLGCGERVILVPKDFKI